MPPVAFRHGIYFYPFAGPELGRKENSILTTRLIPAACGGVSLGIRAARSSAVFRCRATRIPATIGTLCFCQQRGWHLGRPGHRQPIPPQEREEELNRADCRHEPVEITLTHYRHSGYVPCQIGRGMIQVGGGYLAFLMPGASRLFHIPLKLQVCREASHWGYEPSQKCTWAE